ncbi:MAG: polyprenyl synthetase family protein [Propionibacteriaceae bacterium]|nr:polyprenyl synthetase family protein [Propionibacteriaceae bacterium]
METLSLTDEAFAQWIAEHNERVGVRLKETLRTPYSFVEEVATYLIDAGGKLFRPSLVFAAGGLGLESGSVDEEGLISAAVVVELTHVASLYHDDVMDEAALRRGGPTAHRKWGNSVAIMVGDFMLAQASLVGAKLGEEFMTYQAKTLSRLVQGQIGEMKGPEPDVDDLTHHLAVVSNKTAALIAAAARYGATFAGLPGDQVEALTQYGERLGMAFQLADDLLDILSDESGKQAGTDLREGVPTVATLLVQRQQRDEDARLLELLARPVAEADLPEALDLLRVHPAVAEARAHVKRWADEAATYLSGLDDGPAVRALRTLCEQAIVRSC